MNSDAAAGPAPAAESDDAARSRGGRYRLLRTAFQHASIEMSIEQRAVVEHVGGRLRVLAGPGTGKTATIVEAVADRILRRGVDPSAILVLTFSRRAARELSDRIAARLDVTVTEPLVRTLHSYAYALVRLAALAAGDPPPRLLDAGQSDLMVRDMLAGHVQDGAANWPADLRAALLVPTFAAELREFMLRTAEQQISPRRIAALGRASRRPEWTAVARFVEEYRDIADLRQAASRFGAALDQAELTTAALDRLADPTVLAGQQARIRRIFVDEYQDVDPAQARLIDLLASGADELVVVGDPDQSIYAFRGSAAGALQHVEVDDTAALTVSRRLPPVLLEATRRVAVRIPGTAIHRQLRAANPDADGGIDVRVLPTAAIEAAYVADQLRRAHLEHGIAWSEMAVLLRSPDRPSGPLRRALAAARVPVTTGAVLPVAFDPLVAALLAVLRAGIDPASMTGTSALGLLASPLGGMDPLAIRRLRRAVRVRQQAPVAGGSTGAAGMLPGRSADRVAAILLGRIPIPAGLSGDLAGPLRRSADLIDIARRGAAEPAAEEVLWRVWQHSGLAGRLLAASERGGSGAAGADVMLDAVVTLFDRAADLADQLPGTGVAGLLELLAGEQISSPGGDGRSAPAVAILSAHAAKGLEWDVVAIAGVQQEVWPDLRPRASLLDLPALLDAAAGFRKGTPLAGQLADERRLFYVAATRARRRLIVTAVQDDENTPSRFLPELAGTDEVRAGWPRSAQGGARRALHLPALLAELRRAVTTGGVAGTAEGDVVAVPAQGVGPDAADVSRSGESAGAAGGLAHHSSEATSSDVEQAVHALARLAVAGVAGAHPDGWHGLLGLSTDAPLVPEGAEVILSPSQVESLTACPLRAVLEKQGGRGGTQQAQLVGTAVHALAQGIAAGLSDAELDEAARGFLDAQEDLPPWEIARLRRQLDAMMQALREWVRTTAADRRLLGSEVPLDVILPAAGAAAQGGVDRHAELGSTHPTRLLGRADWLSVDADGRLVITDFKTGSSPPTAAAVREYAQLAVYQLAAALGAFGSGFGDRAAADGERTVDDSRGDDSCGDDSCGDGAYGQARDPDHAGPGGEPVAEGPAVGGAELVYLRTGKPKTYLQQPQDEQERAVWIERLSDVARSVSGAVVVAREGEACLRCPVRSSCPLQPEGRQVAR